MKPRALAFALALWRRHGARRRRPRGAARLLTLRRSPGRAALVVPAVVMRTTLVHAPRLALAVTAVQRHEHAAAVVERRLRTEQVVSHTLVERLLLRRERVERLPLTAAPTPPHAARFAPGLPGPPWASRPPALAPTPVPPVVRRHTTIERSATEPIDAAPAPPAVARSPAAPAPLPGPPGPAGASVATGPLVDEVLAAIDQRIVAQRERLGRLP